MLRRASRSDAESVAGDPLTRNYRPSYGGQPAWFGKLSHVFHLGLIDTMMYDSTVALGVAMIETPVIRHERQWKILADSPEIEKLVDRTLSVFWQRSIRSLLTHIRYGYAGGEALYEIDDNRMMKFQGVKPLYQRDIAPGRDPETGHFGGVLLTQGDRRRELRAANGPRPAKGFWVYQGSEFNNWYGATRFLAAYPPWREKNGQDGTLDIIRMWYYKNAYSGLVIRYPEKSMRVASGQYIPARDMARQIAEVLKTGGVAAVPSTVDVKTGQKEWEIEWPHMNGNAEGLLEYLNHQDGQILRGLKIPDDVVAGQGGGYAGAKVSEDAFYTMEEDLLHSIAVPLKEQVVDPLVWYNFGKGEKYRIEYAPMLPARQQLDAVKQAGAAAKGGGNPEAQPTPMLDALAGGSLQKPPGGDPGQAQSPENRPEQVGMSLVRLADPGEEPEPATPAPKPAKASDGHLHYAKAGKNIVQVRLPFKANPNLNYVGSVGPEDHKIPHQGTLHVSRDKKSGVHHFHSEDGRYFGETHSKLPREGLDALHARAARNLEDDVSTLDDVPASTTEAPAAAVQVEAPKPAPAGKPRRVAMTPEERSAQADKKAAERAVSRKAPDEGRAAKKPAVVKPVAPESTLQQDAQKLQSQAAVDKEASGPIEKSVTDGTVAALNAAGKTREAELVQHAVKDGDPKEAAQVIANMPPESKAAVHDAAHGIVKQHLDKGDEPEEKPAATKTAEPESSPAPEAASSSMPPTPAVGGHTEAAPATPDIGSSQAVAPSQTMPPQPAPQPALPVAPPAPPVAPQPAAVVPPPTTPPGASTATPPPPPAAPTTPQAGGDPDQRAMRDELAGLRAKGQKTQDDHDRIAELVGLPKGQFAYLGKSGDGTSEKMVFKDAQGHHYARLVPNQLGVEHEQLGRAAGHPKLVHARSGRAVDPSMFQGGRHFGELMDDATNKLAAGQAIDDFDRAALLHGLHAPAGFEYVDYRGNGKHVVKDKDGNEYLIGHSTDQSGHHVLVDAQTMRPVQYSDFEDNEQDQDFGKRHTDVTEAKPDDFLKPHYDRTVTVNGKPVKYRDYVNYREAHADKHEWRKQQAAAEGVSEHTLAHMHELEHRYVNGSLSDEDKKSLHDLHKSADNQRQAFDTAKDVAKQLGELPLEQQKQVMQKADQTLAKAKSDGMTGGQIAVMIVMALLMSRRGGGGGFLGSLGMFVLGAMYFRNGGSAAVEKEADTPKAPKIREVPWGVPNQTPPGPGAAHPGGGATPPTPPSTQTSPSVTPPGPGVAPPAVSPTATAAGAGSAPPVVPPVPLQPGTPPGATTAPGVAASSTPPTTLAPKAPPTTLAPKAPPTALAPAAQSTTLAPKASPPAPTAPPLPPAVKSATSSPQAAAPLASSHLAGDAKTPPWKAAMAKIKGLLGGFGSNDDTNRPEGFSPPGVKNVEWRNGKWVGKEGYEPMLFPDGHPFGARWKAGLPAPSRGEGVITSDKEGEYWLMPGYVWKDKKNLVARKMEVGESKGNGIATWDGEKFVPRPGHVLKTDKHGRVYGSALSPDGLRSHWNNQVEFGDFDPAALEAAEKPSSLTQPEDAVPQTKDEKSSVTQVEFGDLDPAPSPAADAPPARQPTQVLAGDLPDGVTEQDGKFWVTDQNDDQFSFPTREAALDYLKKIRGDK